MKRPDLDNRIIAGRWLNGESQLDLSVAFDCSVRTISDRLVKARTEFPALPWDDRKAVPGGAASGGSGVKGYVRMNDGKPGESARPRGSIVNGGALRRR